MGNQFSIENQATLAGQQPAKPYDQASYMNAQLAAIRQQIHASEERIRQLEKHIHYPHNETAMKEAAAKAQVHFGQVDQPVPMRSDVETIRTMTAFIKRLIDREDFAYAVTLEVRNEARRALAIKEREV